MMQRNNTKAFSRGFTLVELLVVVAIIGLLASVVIATVSSIRIKAKDARVKTEMRSIRLALESYATEHGGYPNPTPGDSGIWCIGATDCMVADTVIEDSTDDWGVTAMLQIPTSQNSQYLAAAGDLFAGVDFSNSPSFQDSANPPNTNKGYVYVSCISNDAVCPENPTEIDGSDKAYLVYPQSEEVKAMQVGTFEELTCNEEIYAACGEAGGDGLDCGPNDDEECLIYSYIAGACDYDPDGTMEDPAMCICGYVGASQHCDDWSNVVGACNYDPNGSGADNGMCNCGDGTESCVETCDEELACNYGQPFTCEYSSCECTNPYACNFLALGQCDYSCIDPCTDTNACNYGEWQFCDYSCYGTCEDSGACNYGESGECDYSCHGDPACEDSGACNYGEIGDCDYSCQAGSCSGSFLPDCSASNDEDCVAGLGCIWGGSTSDYCSGTPSLTCDELDQNACTQYSGCSWDYYEETENYHCGGTPNISCDGGDESSCEQYSGCQWISGSPDYCYVDPNGSCTNYTDESTCEGVNACSWE